MEGTSSVCPECKGLGKWCVAESGGMSSLVVCPVCNGEGIVETTVSDVGGMFQGCNHNVPTGITGPGSQVNGYPRTGATTDPYWTPQPSKTLLDEFAMAAMTAFHPSQGEAVDVIVLDAYNIAAAMMTERARRDEMGNVKEVK